MQETRIRPLGQANPLKTTYSVTLAWEIPEQRSLAGYSPWGHKRVRYELVTKQQQQQQQLYMFFLFLHSLPL